MSIPESILDLIERFERNIDAYRSGAYNETQVRREFIDPFFKALGWDVDNEKGYAEQYKDVVHEDSLKTGDTTKAPDYSFRIGGQRKFFVEAKKPSIDIRGDTHPAFQLRRYAWSAKLPLSILTDFEEFAVYDCRVKPVSNDKAGKARIKYLKYSEYIEKWDEIVSIFSRDAILIGSFDKFAESTRKKRGTAEVDDAFLVEIESWRDSLARHIALRNPKISQRDLNYAVQRTIDRIIFLRICEDRGVEPYGRLRDLLVGTDVYPHLVDLFHKADQRYNSGLFHFKKERDRPDPDTITPNLILDDKVLKDILRRLYYPDSPYEFSVLPADILGHIYEQFLGKVIRLTPGGRAKIEEKPEVRKAGGVYYTPTYIVDYIVEHTVGKLLDRKKPGAISKLRILDPACGSGSFLLGAYQYLLDWHLKYYTENDPCKFAKKKTPPIYQCIPATHSPGTESINQSSPASPLPGMESINQRSPASPLPGMESTNPGYRLTTTERKRILLNNIYGVDIDPQAVEVTKLSLLLKVLEDESRENIDAHMRLFHERALPDLAGNIKCGNSLIGPDFYDNMQMTLLDDEERYRINVFDWVVEFPDAFKAKNPGFDAVIGNPPYIGFHRFKEYKDYLKSKYTTTKGKFDYYIPFIEKSHGMLNEKGLLGYICPNNFMKRQYGTSIRDLLRNNSEIVEICDFEDVQIFKGALNYTGIIIIRKAQPNAKHYFDYKKRNLTNKAQQVLQANLTAMAWVIRSPNVEKIIQNIQGDSENLGNFTSAISEGIVTGNNDVFLLQNKVVIDLELEGDLNKTCIRGSDIRRYYISNPDQVVIYPYIQAGNKSKVISSDSLEKFPKTYKYLRSKKNELSGRPYFERSSKLWYELWCQRDISILGQRKIVVPEIAESNRYAIAESDQFYGDTVCGITFSDNVEEKLEYFLGILNSKAIEFFYKQTTVPKANKYFIYKTMFLRNIPIRRIDLSDTADKSRHDRMVELVDHMLELHKQLNDASSPHEKEVLQRQIDATDSLIDKLVYELYDLTDEEIKIVEEGI